MKRSIVLLAVVLVAACKSEPLTIVTPPSAQASAPAPPPDHLAKNELLEGSAKAFGLVLPLGVRIDAAFADVIFASGQVPDEAVVQYVRARVREGKMIRPDFAGDGRTKFDHVKVPATPDREYAIFVGPARGVVGGTKIEIRDVTPVKAPSLPDDTARWKKAGLSPNGAVLDPSQLQ